MQNWLQNNLSDSEGALLLSLKDLCKDEAILYSHLWGEPLRMLKEILQNRLQNTGRLELLVRQVDVLWAKLYGERPMLQAHGVESKPGDPYTHESVKNVLLFLVNELCRLLD